MASRGQRAESHMAQLATGRFTFGKKKKKCDTAFLRTELVSAKSQDADLRSGRVPAATRGQHLPGMRD